MSGSALSNIDTKREAKKQQLADSALETLKKNGYARTTLRDIAQESGVSLGILHYYFDSKEDLLIYCVERYKSDFIADINTMVTGATTQEKMIQALSKGLASTLSKEAETHRLWYDMRAQAMFDTTFQPIVKTVDASLRDLFKPLLPTENLPALERLYSAADGQFQYFLQKLLYGKKISAKSMQAAFESTIGKLLK